MQLADIDSPVQGMGMRLPYVLSVVTRFRLCLIAQLRAEFAAIDAASQTLVLVGAGVMRTAVYVRDVAALLVNA